MHVRRGGSFLCRGGRERQMLKNDRRLHIRRRAFAHDDPSLKPPAPRIERRARLTPGDGRRREVEVLHDTRVDECRRNRRPADGRDSADAVVAQLCDRHSQILVLDRNQRDPRTRSGGSRDAIDGSISGEDENRHARDIEQQRRVDIQVSCACQDDLSGVARRARATLAARQSPDARRRRTRAPKPSRRRRARRRRPRATGPHI